MQLGNCARFPLQWAAWERTWQQKSERMHLEGYVSCYLNNKMRTVNLFVSGDRPDHDSIVHPDIAGHISHKFTASTAFPGVRAQRHKSNRRPHISSHTADAV